METTTTATTLPKQIDYHLRSTTAPDYKMMRIPLNNFPGATVSIDPTGSITLEWKLPNALPYNLYRSYISWNEHIPAQGAGKFTHTFEDVFDLGHSITFGSAGGTDLVNLQHAQNYSKISRKIHTDLDDFLGNDDMSGLYKSNNAASLTFVPGGYNRATPVGVDVTPTYQATENIIDVKQIHTSEADDRPVDRYRQYPLGAFKGTLLGVDRDFWSPVEQYLRVQAGTGDKMAFTGTDDIVTKANANPPEVVNPAAGAASIIPGAKITLNSIYLYLCVEQNVEIVQNIKSAYAAGKLTYSIPYTQGFKMVGSLNGQQTNISHTLSQQYGKRLKRILHTVWNPQEKWNTAYDCANYNGEKILSYQTFMDSMPIQDRILSCQRPLGTQINSDDWLENKKFLDKRSVYSSKEMYGIHWFHMDQFFEPHDKMGSLPEVNIDEGIPMTTSKTWLFSGQVNPAASAANLIHYTYAEFSRDIIITNMGPVWVMA